MEIKAIKLRKLVPPKDDLLAAIAASRLKLKNGDVLAVASKVVSIGEGRCVPIGSIEKKKLIEQEADLLAQIHSKWGSRFTITRGMLIGSAGIDESNGNGYYILWPKDPMRSARQLRVALMRHYKIKKLGVIIADSHSMPLHRGALGFCLGWAGIDPHNDYRGLPDIFGRSMRIGQQNLADALAAAAVVVMGEGSEQTPLATIRGAPSKVFKGRHSKSRYTSRNFVVPLKDDLFAPFLLKVKWKKGKGK